MSIRRAMLFAAGLGTRLRPLTERVPKALVEVGGRPLLNYNLQHFLDHGCERVVVNTHHLASQLAAHLQELEATMPGAAAALRVCHEQTLLETGGGIVNALPLLGNRPFFCANSDAFWIDGPTPALARMEAAWNEANMDALLLLVPLAQAVGYGGKGDFERNAAGQLTRSTAPGHVFTGLQILHPRLFQGRTSGAFSLREVYSAAQQADGTLRRMFGLVHDAAWVHVGTPEERTAADSYLARTDR